MMQLIYIGVAIVMFLLMVSVGVVGLGIALGVYLIWKVYYYFSGCWVDDWNRSKKD